MHYVPEERSGRRRGIEISEAIVVLGDDALPFFFHALVLPAHARQQFPQGVDLTVYLPVRQGLPLHPGSHRLIIAQQPIVLGGHLAMYLHHRLVHGAQPDVLLLATVPIAMPGAALVHPLLIEVHLPPAEKEMVFLGPQFVDETS